MLKALKSKDGKKKSFLFNERNESIAPQVTYLVKSVLKFRKFIEEIIKRSKINELSKKKFSYEILLLLVYDLIFEDRGKIRLGKHPLKTEIMKFKLRLKEEFVRMKIRYKVKDISEVLLKYGNNKQEKTIQWFRINTLKNNPNEVLLDPFFLNLKTVENLNQIQKGNEIYKDTFIENLYAVSVSCNITKSKLYTEDMIILQDRASCFPAHVLLSEGSFPHREIIDSCAAPGNKTTHCAAILQQKQEQNFIVHAFEKDSHRATILEDLCKKKTSHSVRDTIKIVVSDFTEVDPAKYKNVTAILVDPSCSGSGILGRELEDSYQLLDQKDLIRRITNLSLFQYKIVKHALLFPNVKKVVYSTCSLNEEENECVVAKLLIDPDIISRGWTLENKEHVIPSWTRRGLVSAFDPFFKNETSLSSCYAESCIRFLPYVDGGIGFFLACFVKKLNNFETK